jgi:hypothetical protein
MRRRRRKRRRRRRRYFSKRIFLSGSAIGRHN